MIRIDGSDAGVADGDFQVVGGGDELRAFGKHSYAQAGTYTVTVTASPTGAAAITLPVEVEVGS